MASAKNWMNVSHSTGTTIVAMEFDGGVVLGADSRTRTGQYVANRVADKLTKVTDKIYCCRNGSAADTQAIVDVVSYSLYYNENTTGQDSLVADAASKFRNFCYDYKNTVWAGIIGGWDKKHGGQVYSIPLRGMLTRQKVAVEGSGDTYILGLINEFYKKGMSRSECLDLIIKAIKQAILFDGSSGGIIRTCIISEDGVDRNIHIL